MRRCFKAHDVPIPEFYIVSELDEFMEATKHFTTKFIIKPADNSGNRGGETYNRYSGRTGFDPSF